MKILVTGTAGFIGFHTALRLSSMGHTVTGVDHAIRHSDLHRARLALLSASTAYSHVDIDLAHRETLDALFSIQAFDIVIHLAA